MCFSMSASLIAGSALSVAGALTIKKANTKKEILFASIPLIFGIQQLMEGAVWFSLARDVHLLNLFATYGFIIIAYVVWPILIPLSILLLEKKNIHKKILKVLLGLGTLLGLYLLYFIVSKNIVSGINCNSIIYTAPSRTEYGLFLTALYVSVISLSGMFSSYKMVKVLGVVMLTLFVIAYYFYTVSFISVWCFFAAVLSVVIYLHFVFDKNRITKNERK